MLKPTTSFSKVPATRQLTLNHVGARPRHAKTSKLTADALPDAALGALKLALVSAEIDAAPVLESSEPLSPQLLGFGAVALLAVAGVAWRVASYSQIEYITAAMLSRHVPTDDPGSRVIQLGGGTRELFYYPKNTQQVTVVGDNINKGLVEQAGMQALTPALARRQSYTDLGFAADGSIDAVVDLFMWGDSSAEKRNASVQEILRVLKPGRPLIFIERLEDSPAALRPLAGGSKGIESTLLEAIKSNPGFQLVTWDIALEGQDPHAVGVAIKSGTQQAAPNSNKANKGSKANTPTKGYGRK